MNVVEVRVHGLIHEQKTQQNIVILREASGERIKQTLGKVRERIDKGRERVEHYVRSA